MSLNWVTGTINKSFWYEFTMTKPKLLALLCSMLLLASGTQLGEAHGPSHNLSRYDYVMPHGVPEPYQELLNPLRMTPENISGVTAVEDHLSFSLPT